MPRDVNGIYTLPSGNPVVPGTTVSSDWANQTMQDIATALTGSLAVPGSVTPDHLNLNAAGFRSKIGLGNVATLNTGTSGATVPLCNGAITWASLQNFQNNINVTGTVTTGGTATFGAAVTVQTGNFRVSNGQSTLAKASQTITDWATAGALINGAPDAVISFQVPGVRAGALGITGDNELSWKTNADGVNFYKVWTLKNFNPASKQDALGYTPVRQGGGALMGTNTTYIGWRSDATLGLRVDSTEFGNTWPINISGSAASMGGIGSSSYMRKDIAQIMGNNITMSNGGNDAPSVQWVTSGAGAMSVDVDCVGSVFRAYVNNGAGGNAFEFDCGAQTFLSFGQTVIRSSNLASFIATSDAYQVGSYMFCKEVAGGAMGPNSTLAGSNLRPASNSTYNNAIPLSGTWRCMGSNDGNDHTLMLRIS